MAQEKTQREDALKAQLRRNLKRRKAQQRTHPPVKRAADEAGARDDSGA